VGDIKGELVFRRNIMSITYHQPNYEFICGVDLHSKMTYICIINQEKEVLVHRNIKGNCLDTFLEFLKPYLGKIAISAEACFPYYWLAEFCEKNNIDLLLGHPLYMKHIHGGKAKNDRIDSKKIAMLTINHMLPFAYAYPQDRVHLRDILRRRSYFVHKSTELQNHVKIQGYQANNPISGKISKSKGRDDQIIENFSNMDQQLSVEINLDTIRYLNRQAEFIKQYAEGRLKDLNPIHLNILQSIQGVGPIISMTILLEIDDISRFPTHKKFASYARLIKCTHSSAGKNLGCGNSKIGNPHLKSVLGSAAVLIATKNPRIKSLADKLESKHGKGKALSIMAHKLGRTIYYMLKNEKVFDIDKFLNNF